MFLSTIARVAVIQLVLLSLWTDVVSARTEPSPAVVSGELRQWHRITLTFEGPQASETGQPNPFRHYRMNVTFAELSSHQIVLVPGFFAADGEAGETSAQQGNRWRVHFSPPRPGTWRYSVSFRSGSDVALSTDPHAGEAWRPLDGATGTFEVATSDKRPPDFRARGALQYVGERYLRFAHDDTYFLKAGVGSPETLLAYAEFDGTYRDLKTDRHPPAPNGLIPLPSLTSGLLTFEPHRQDWREGDPTWRGGKGKGLIGGINYLATQGVNALYFVTMNVNGDGRNVWPWIDPDARDRFDCSKLDQWEMVFSHLTRNGIMLHIVTQETENDHLLDRGDLGPYRKLYYRELVARFAHHPAITWNLGEENVQSPRQQIACMNWLRSINPYHQHTVVHNDHWHAKNLHETFDPLLGSAAFTGTAIQDFHWNDIHTHVLRYVRSSAAAGRPWVVSADEMGGANFGTLPDADDPRHDHPRRYGLWATLMAGGAGVEWYFGWQNNSPLSDLSAQDWRSREKMYQQTRTALQFFRRQLKFWHMDPMDNEIVGAGVFGLAAPGETYALYLPHGGGTRFDLGHHPGIYEVKWFDPRRGGDLQDGSVTKLRGPGLNWTGFPPSEPTEDWVVLIRRIREPYPETAYPGAKWESADPLEAGVDPTGLHHALNNWRMLAGPEGIDRVVVVRRGRVIYQGSRAAEPGDLRSATKSLTSTLLGVLVGRDLVQLSDYAARYEPLLRDRYSRLTLRDFATMTSGYSAVGESRWGEASADWSKTPYEPAEPLFPPGSQYAYWDEAQMMYGRVLTQVAGADLLNVARQHLFSPIGIPDTANDWGVEGEIEGIPVRNGCTGLLLNALDLARVGHLYLNHGRWNGHTILPGWFVQAATSAQVPSTLPLAATDRANADGRGVYGFNWWLNGRTPEGALALPHAPPGTYYAAGFNHNICLVIPEWEMVIARVASPTDGNPPGGHARTLDTFLRRLSMAIYELP